MRQKNSIKKSPYKGVCWNTQRQKWRAYVTVNGAFQDVGFYDTDREAVRSRDLKIMALNLDVPLQVFKKKLTEKTE